MYVACNLNTLTIVRWDYSAGESNGSSSTCLSTCLSRRSVALRSVCTPGRVKKKKSPLLLVLLPPRSLCAHLLACMCECVHLRAHVPQVCARMRELCACWSLHTHTHTQRQYSHNEWLPVARRRETLHRFFCCCSSIETLSSGITSRGGEFERGAGHRGQPVSARRTLGFWGRVVPSRPPSLSTTTTTTTNCICVCSDG